MRTSHAKGIPAGSNELHVPNEDRVVAGPNTGCAMQKEAGIGVYKAYANPKPVTQASVRG